MGFVIGMDEAGYGPNLGPLVLTATVWEVPGRWPKKTDFWKTFDSVAEREITKKKGASGRKAGTDNGGNEGAETRPPADDRLHIADSKEVYCPATGLGALERGRWQPLAWPREFRPISMSCSTNCGAKASTNRPKTTVTGGAATCGSRTTSRSRCP